MVVQNGALHGITHRRSIVAYSRRDAAAPDVVCTLHRVFPDIHCGDHDGSGEPHGCKHQLSEALFGRLSSVVILTPYLRKALIAVRGRTVGYAIPQAQFLGPPFRHSRVVVIPFEFIYKSS